MGDTSIASYTELKESGQLGELQESIVQILQQHPEGVSTLEIAESLGIGRDSISPRMPELRKLGVVADVGRVVLPGKRRSVIRWGLVS